MARKLGRDCARWVGVSEGKINLAIGVKFDFGPESKSPATNRTVKKITLSKWTVHKYIEGDSKPTKDECFKLRRAHGKADKGKKITLANRYLFSVEWDNGVIVT